jgi:mRNA-degrading endonuclease RelE of RelBE toxin-antitoxin system
MARVTLSPQAVQQFEGLPLTIRARMLRTFERLQNWPEVSGAKPLRGVLAGHWRLRTGDYRIRFSVEGDVVRIEEMGHRDGFYGS